MSIAQHTIPYLFHEFLNSTARYIFIFVAWKNRQTAQQQRRRISSCDQFCCHIYQLQLKFPPDAEIKQTLLDYDSTISAVKNAVKEAVRDLTNELPGKEPGTAVIDSSAATEDLMTPTKTISAFTAFPSPVTVRGQPVSSKNLCTKNSCTFGKKLRKHVWIKCSHRSEAQGCAYWVHAPCIGFPYLKEENVKLLDGWCCPDHTDIQMKRK